ncbi:MAG TPA: LuxR C-terminal-related transcriptional regulator [Tepidisphaeraceae bacterium]|nr:LuxR C-terminal-related transcriptional regulator [Tepidisphaeraceae bacterium]
MTNSNHRQADLRAMLRALEPLSSTGGSGGDINPPGNAAGGTSEAAGGGGGGAGAGGTGGAGDGADVQRNRQLVADFCRLVGTRFGQGAAIGADLPPRVRQTLSSLLAGASEKEIAQALQLSRHTVHVYVKQIYRHYNVCRRGELLARWVKSEQNPAPAHPQR